MTTIVKNVGVMSGFDTNGAKVFGDQGTVKVEYQGQQYNFGPNDSKALEDGIAAALVAADNRLRVATQADGMGPKSSASTSFGIY